jgi:hypothetical protein
MVVVLAMYVAARVVLPVQLSDPVALSVASNVSSTSWYRYLLRWDSAWYATILKEGYKYDGNDLVQQSVSYYPLYPLIAKALTIFAGIDGLLALLVVANVAAALSVLLLFNYQTGSWRRARFVNHCICEFISNVPFFVGRLYRAIGSFADLSESNLSSPPLLPAWRPPHASLDWC